MEEGSAFAVPAFRRFWLCRLFGAMAGQMQAVAVGWQVYDITHRALDLGLVGLAMFLPSLLLALLTGQVADRHDRRIVLAGAQGLDLACMVALLYLSISHNGDVRWIFAVLVVTGTARAFTAPASFALLPNLVAPAQFSSAAAWISTAWQSATVVGPAIGGFLYIGGAVAVYGTCAVMMALSTSLVLSLPSRKPGGALRALSWDSLLAGIHFIRANDLVRGAITLDLFAVLLGGATALLPVYARDILHVGPSGLGLLRSAPGMGALLTAFLLVRFPIQRQAGRRLLAAVALFGSATIAFGFSTNLSLSLALLVIMGAADMVSVVIRRVLVQVATPDEMRGRVSAVESVFIGASNELGEFESGVTAALFGVVPAVVLGGFGTLFVVGWCARVFPRLLQVDRVDRDLAGE